MKYSELANKQPLELEETGNKLREELFHLRIKSVTGQLEKKNRIREVRRDVARVKTRLTELSRKKMKEIKL